MTQVQNYVCFNTAWQRLIHCWGYYGRTTHVHLSAELRTECMAYLNGHLRSLLNLPTPPRLPWASFDNILDVLQKNIYGRQAPRFKSARERNQLAFLILICAYTAARPGEIATSAGYEDDNEGLRYGDLSFSLTRSPHGTTRLQLDVCIRNLKGLRSDESKYRIQPLYEDPSVPFCADAVLLAFSLALQDDVFADMEAYDLANYQSLAQHSADEERTSTSSEFRLDLPIRPEKVDLMICRKHVWLDGTWELHPVQGVLAKRMGELLSMVAKMSGYDNFTFMSIRRSVATALNTPNVTAEDARRAVGHRPGSTIWERSYISKRTDIDIQGLVSHGTERRAETTHAGIRKTSLPSLTYTEICEAECADVILKRNLEEKEAIRSELAAQHGEASNARGTQRYKEWKKVSLQCSARRTFVRDQVRAKKGRESELGSRLEGLQTLSKATNVILAVLDEIEVESPTGDDVSCAAATATASASASASIVSPAPIDPALLALDDHSSSAPVAHHPDTHAVALAHRLSELLNGHEQGVGSTSSLQPLCSQPRTISFAEAHVLLWSSSVATRNAPWFHSCPHCQKSIGALSYDRRTNHVESCFQAALIREVALQVAKVFYLRLEQPDQKPCPIIDCKRSSYPTTVSGYEDAKRFIDHLHQHVNKFNNVRLLQCRIKTAEGRACSFTVRHDGSNRIVNCAESTDVHRVAWWIHLDSMHGIIFPTSQCVRVCLEHEERLLGWHAVEEHSQEHFMAISTEMDAFDFEHLCIFCFRDTNLSFTNRAKRFGESQNLMMHINSTHIFSYLQDSYECPVCDELVDIAIFHDHLADHGLRLRTLATHREHSSPKVDGDFETLVCFGSKHGKDQCAAWIKFINATPTEREKLTSANTHKHVLQRAIPTPEQVEE